MNNWYSLVYKALIYASVILFLISFGTTGNTTIGAVISGYSALTLSILMILIMLLNSVLNTTANHRINKESTQSTWSENIFIRIFSSAPGFSKLFKRIVKGIVP